MQEIGCCFESLFLRVAHKVNRYLSSYVKFSLKLSVIFMLLLFLLSYNLSDFKQCMLYYKVPSVILLSSLECEIHSIQL